MGGLVFQESMTTKGAETIIDAGTGTLTVIAGKTVSTTQQILTITTSDFDVHGTIRTETKPVRITTDNIQVEQT